MSPALRYLRDANLFLLPVVVVSYCTGKFVHANPQMPLITTQQRPMTRHLPYGMRPLYMPNPDGPYLGMSNLKSIPQRSMHERRTATVTRGTFHKMEGFIEIMPG